MAKSRRPARARARRRTLDAMPDTVDFRDKMYVPNLIEVRPHTDLELYRQRGIPVLDQGREGACTGFGLATVVNYLIRTSTVGLTPGVVSPRMLYVMARRYDEWPGEDYEGSSARGAMKGWHKHGVCARDLWKDGDKRVDLDDGITGDALGRPLGAYFRVNHKDIVAMHSAITEAGILYATCNVHSGWMDVEEGDTQIPYSATIEGGHAFAIVGYDREGFWLQNSWGPKWGSGGLIRLGYGDWLANGSDVWVARLGAPANLADDVATARMRSGAPRSYESYVLATLRPHVVMAENDGRLMEKGPFGLTSDGLKKIVRTQLPEVVALWPKKRVLLYSHGGLVSQDSALQYVANTLPYCLAANVYPIAFIWRSDAWTTLGNILRDALSRRRDEGIFDAAKDFMLDRLDDTIEPIARTFGGKALWDEMKENATLASSLAAGAARITAGHVAAAIEAREIDEVHLAGHSAGSILLAPLAKLLIARGVKIASLSLWAPACTLELFNTIYKPEIVAGNIGAFDLYTLDDPTERDDDCANIYHKSLLYLVSAAFEEIPRMPLTTRRNGTPILGLARDVESTLKGFWTKKRRWIAAPGERSAARHHGDFDNDPKTLISTLETITGKPVPQDALNLDLPEPVSQAAHLRQHLDIGTARFAVRK